MGHKPAGVVVHRGEIWLVRFDSSVGAEIKNLRPALIVQNDIANKYSPLTIVAPITSKIDTPTTLYPTEVFILKGQGGLDKDSLVVLNQVRSLDKKRLFKCLGSLSLETMKSVDRALCEAFGILV